MVETLNNRLLDDKLDISNVGLVIIDEAHYNSFTKLFKFFSTSFILGVTATPLSSNINLPMNDNYDELIVGESIKELISNRFLAKADLFTYNVGLTSLVVGANDTVNPAARSDEGPLAGMPIINADKARVVVMVKRSLSVGYAGVDNDLFYEDKTMMLFGDGKK